MTSWRWRGRAAVMAAFAVAALVAGACSSSSPADTGSAKAADRGSTPARGSGPVNVLYAGSLVTLMEKHIAPAFHDATGYTFDGFAAGSSALAAQIKGKVRRGDVFISASPAVNASLQGPGNGSWVSWYATYASSPLVLGYNPKSEFAADLTSAPWYDVITEPGFRIGRTDPANDPKGKLAVQALTDTATAQRKPELAAMATSTSNVFSEETLVGRLQSGQLDAGFFYHSEAVAAGIDTVPLTGVDLRATYTVTVLNGAPHEAAAEAFVAFLLGDGGRRVLTKDGFDLVSRPALSGSGVPDSLRDILSGP